MKMIKKAVMAAAVMLIAGAAHAGSEFIVFGEIYNADGSKGFSFTENSYAGVRLFRVGINNEAARQYNNINYGNCQDRVFAPGDGEAAYYYTDAGSTAWQTSPQAGQTVVVLAQVYSDQFAYCPWSGATYIGVKKDTVTSTNKLKMQDLRLEQVPHPQPQSIAIDSVTLTWKGISQDPDDLITGYTVYRGEAVDGVYEKITGTAAQSKGGQVSFTDSYIIDAWRTYYYKIAVNVMWGGGNGAPDYYISEAMSGASSGVTLINPTPTITPTISEPTATPTATPTPDIVAQNVQKGLLKHKLMLFPNPVKGNSFRIAFASTKDAQAVIQIYTVKGEVVRVTTVQVNAGANIFEQQVSKLSPGIYIVKVVLDGNKDLIPAGKVAIIK